MTSSTASSNFNLRATYNPNENVASISNYDTRDKIVAGATRQFEFIRDAKTTISLIYEGRTGRPYSWVFKGDANGDGYTANDLFYVPSGPDDARVRWTNTAERDAFFAFVNNSGLAEYRGAVVSRNSERAPWVQTFDLRVAQEIPLHGRVKAELFANVINFANFFDDSWGIVEEVVFAYRRQVAGTTYDPAANGGQGQYVYTFNADTLDGVPTVADETSASRWQIQIGARVKF